MLVFGTQMHVVTFTFVILEIAMLFYQVVYYLFRPQDKGRLWYMILLIFLIFYNITGGLFPDENIEIPIINQNIIAYGSGFLMASYFPFYFFKGFELTRLRFHALYGVPILLLIPYLVFFVVGYSINGNLDSAIKHGVIIPFFYAIVVLVAILRSIRLKYFEAVGAIDYKEMIAVYCAVIPWASMPILAYLHVSQLTEVMFTNVGFLIITIIFISKSIKKARRENELLLEIDFASCDPRTIEINCKRFGLTSKEAEIVQLICQRLKFKDIAEKLFISPRTVDKHAENIYNKVSVSTRGELIRKMNDF
ncbi:MAG: LuxR family transcriptional regulator [Flavobacterium sp.]|nr:MAG: LuxR family transcriptional regulator [Flavobacterium sp.]